jgi:hypothetical protein
MTYGASNFSRGLLQASDPVVLGLFRYYGYRTRAEGVMVAKSLAQHGKPFLVVSGTVLPAETGSLFCAGPTPARSEHVERPRSSPRRNEGLALEAGESG